MFRPVQYRLLTSYLAVFIATLSVSALAVRLVFIHSLKNQMIARLRTLGQSIAVSAEYENNRLQASDEDENLDFLLNQSQALQWFDLQGHLIKQQGNKILELPFLPQAAVQTQTEPHFIGVTVPILDKDTNRLLGYVRASESMQAFDQTLRHLDLGLGGGILLALLLGGIGGRWLTQQAMQPIEQSFQRLQQFTADASHELRSPLMVIKSNSAVALKYPEGIRDLDIEKFEAIASAAQQMSHLTEDLLFLARHDQMPQRHWQPINLRLLLDDLVQLYQPQAAAKSLELKASLAPTSLTGDPAQLTRLFTNLISNALQYTPADGTITLSSCRAAGWIEVRVEDTGVGIAPEHLEHIFDRFWRADLARTQWEGGAGLGLSIAQSIAHLHGGKISVTSQPGKGSCFVVRLPGT